MKRLSNREKIMLIVTGLMLGLLVYWYWLYNPLLLSLEKTKGNVNALKKQLALQTKAGNGSQAKKTSAFNIYQREEQFTYILSFLDKTLNRYKIDLLSLRESTGEKNKLFVDIKIKSTYHQFLAYINSLADLDTIILVDTAGMVVDKDGSLITEMRLLSGYR